MKKAVALLMLLISITGNLFAQTKPDPTFNVPEGFVFHKMIMFHLDKGNRFSLELADGADIWRVSNVDSLLTMYLKDMSFLKDSLSDPSTSKRIDYSIDSAGIVKIRFQQYQPKGSSFLLRGNEVNALKTDQDTISIIGVVTNPPEATTRLNPGLPRYYRLIVYINNLDELTDYLDGRLNSKVQVFETSSRRDIWVNNSSKNFYLKKDPSITTSRPGGTNTDAVNYISFNADIAIQNYKNYFVPSMQAGVSFAFPNRSRTWKNEIGVSVEAAFLFAKDDKDKVQTYINHFVTLHYSGHRFSDSNNSGANKNNGFTPAASLGYLYNNKGGFYDKNTFRLGVGQYKFQRTTIEPCFYFSGFFKSITPGIRLVQTF